MEKSKIRRLFLVILSLVVIASIVFSSGCKKEEPPKEEFCEITYVTSGTSVNKTIVKKGEAIGSLPFTDKRGYSFSGWFFDEELTNQAYTEDVVNNNIILYAKFEEQDVESVLPEYTEISISSDDKYYEVKFKSKETIDERNINSYILVTALYGNLPKLAINNNNGEYSLSAIGGFINGGVYKIDIVSDEVNFTGIEASYNDDYTEDKTIKTIYLSIDTNDEQTVNIKDNIVELYSDDINFLDDNTFTISKDIHEKIIYDNDTVFHIIFENDEDDRYIKIKDEKQVDDVFELSFIDCDNIDDVYNDFDFNFGDLTLDNEMTDPANKDKTDALLTNVVNELYASKGTEAITKMLASALNASPTIKKLSSDSENPYRDNITDVQGKAFTIKGLLDDLEIKISLGTAMNTNFNGIGISPFDDTRWTMLAISFNYETDIKNNVKLEATITVTQYLYIGLASSANKSSGDFKVEITPYSQTDIDFQILVCSMSKEDEDGNKKEEKKDISVEIENLTNGSQDSSNIIEDVQEMLENKGDAVELCKVPLFQASYSVAGVISINFDLNFVIKVSFAAGVKISATLLEATTIGVTGNYKTKTVDCYRRVAMGSDRYIFDFYAYGYLGLKAGIEGELTVSFIGLKQLFRAGVSIEVGAYADLYGYLHYHAEERRVFKDVDTNGRHFQYLEGGMYFESGIYLELGAFVGVGKKEYGKTKEFKFKLLDAGDKYLYVEASDNADLTTIFEENDDNCINIENLIPVEGKFLNITNGEIETRVIPSKNIKLISNTNLFRVNNEKNILYANLDKIEQRTLYGIPSGTIAIYYKGPNILFSSNYLNENIQELKGYKELCKVKVVYLEEGVELKDYDDLGTEVTITYKVKVNDKEEIVKQETIIAGQYYRGDIPFEITSYCRKNGLLLEIDGDAVTYNGYIEGKHIITEDTTFVFETKEAQRFIAIQYRSQEDFVTNPDKWTIDIMAIGYNETPIILDHQKYHPDNVYFEYFVLTPDGNKSVMGEEYLSKYDLYMRGTYGYETGKVLYSISGSLQELNDIFNKMKNNEGDLKEYSEFFTYTIKTEYITGMHKVYFYMPNGEYSEENVKYGEMFKVPDYWINNINQSTSSKLLGWDTDGDGVFDILPNEQFIVTKDMTLKPIMTSKGYTITVIDLEGVSTSYTIDANSNIPSKILNIINESPGTITTSDENSFYSECYWTITTTDFVAGNDNNPYFKGISQRYYNDITVMPSCDIVLKAIKGTLYHYVTLIDTTDGYYTIKNEKGEYENVKSVKIAVKDGHAVGSSESYKNIELKYTAPKGVTSYSPNYIDENNEVIDFYNAIITEAKTYKLIIWARYDGTYIITFDYNVYYKGEVISKERKHYHIGITDEQEVNRLCELYNQEYDYLTSQAYYDSLNNEEFIYSSYLQGSYDVKQSTLVDGYGVTYITYIVSIRKEHRTFNIIVDFDRDDYVNYSRTVEYGQSFVTDIASNKYINDGTKEVCYYFLGWDVDGDGIVDYGPNLFITITKDMTFKAIYSINKPAS